MLKLNLPGTEVYNEETSKFETVGDIVIELEHSLVSLSKWESSWEKPFFGDEKKTPEQTLTYIQDMMLVPNKDPEIFAKFTDDSIKQVNDYISAKMTATWFNDPPVKGPGGSKEIITAELIYYWMISLNIPFECQHWHLNRLLTLIKVCSSKNAPEKKMSRADVAARNRKLNAERKAKLNTKG